VFGVSDPKPDLVKPTRAPSDEVRVQMLNRLVRWRYAVIAAAFVLFALVGDKDDGDLEFFTQALHILGQGGSQGGLHLYAVRPDIQIGPLAILGTGLLDLVCGGKIVFAVVAGSLVLLLLLVRSLERLMDEEGFDEQQARTALLIGGVVLAAAWAVAVPGWGHIDDLAALTAMVMTLRAVRSGRAVWAGVLLAVALGCKPWGGYACALLLMLPPGRRRAAIATFVGGALACWGPFVIGAPHTISALSHFSLQAIFGSLPLQLGYASAPAWVRPGQVALSTALLVACWHYRRWDLGLLVVAVSRLILDAGVFPYYDVELVVGCVVADVVAAGRSTRLITATAPLSLLSWLVITIIHDANISSTTTFAARTSLYVIVLALGAVRGARGSSAPSDRLSMGAAALPAPRSELGVGGRMAGSIQAAERPTHIGTMARPQRP
jgi:hypothetical protein